MLKSTKLKRNYNNPTAEGFTPTKDKINNKTQALENLSKLDLLKGKTVKKMTHDKKGQQYSVPTWVYIKK